MLRALGAPHVCSTCAGVCPTTMRPRLASLCGGGFGGLALALAGLGPEVLTAWPHAPNGDVTALTGSLLRGSGSATRHACTGCLFGAFRFQLGNSGGDEGVLLDASEVKDDRGTRALLEEENGAI